MEDKKPSPEFKGSYIIRGKIHCLTGLHIGGSKEKLEIGGVDSPVIRNPRTREPYIPGSSLKGKMRHLIEFALGVVHPEGNVSEDEKITRLFGAPANDDPKNEKDRNGPTRLIVRDCHADKDTLAMWKTLDSELLFTEYKPENGINRITSAANPRFIERVVEGSAFNFELVYSIYDMKQKTAEAFKTEINNDLEHLHLAMNMLEHNFLGKSGSRGYGRIEWKFDTPLWFDTAAYKNPATDFSKLKGEPDAKMALSELKLENKL
jgi:CRISPR-associated protein Csm3